MKDGNLIKGDVSGVRLQSERAIDQREDLVKKFPGEKHMKLLPYFVGVLVALAGIGTGYFASGVGAGESTAGVMGEQEGEATEAGITDTETFGDMAEGELVEGGFGGEGPHHLERGAGENKNVYLTSTVINLDNFIGKNVQVWGQTIAAQEAPWLMDVGRVKVK